VYPLLTKHTLLGTRIERRLYLQKRKATAEVVQSPSIGTSQKTEEKKPVREVKRLNVNLSPRLYAELEQLAADQGASITEVVKVGLSLAFFAYTRTGPDRHLTLSDSKGKPIERIIVMPH